MGTRSETDFIGTLEIDNDALFGIHSVRAKTNFPDTTRFHAEWYQALATVKKACYITAGDFYTKASQKLKFENSPIKPINAEVLDSMILAASEIEKGEHFNHFIVPAIQGGAGTSINLNINEIIANRALQILGAKPGQYSLIDPVEHANIFQSTNDVIPTSLKLTLIKLLAELENSLNRLRQQVELIERQGQHQLRKAYTQMQEAVPSSFGRLFSTYSEALSRDWWRISRCIERIKVVNLGGSAIGSGITLPRYFVMEVVHTLQQISRQPLTRSENLYDATSNLNSVVEVHGILKALAVNFEKMASDIRLLASDLHQPAELLIPQKQVGSSIMPGKVNPVIPEFAISASHRVYANDVLIGTLSAQGCLELNAYLPAIGHAAIESLKLLIATANTLNQNLFMGLTIQSKSASEELYRSASITTALVPYLGYNKAAEIARKMKLTQKSIFDLNLELAFIDPKQLQDILSPENLLKEGFSIRDLGFSDE